MKQIQAQFKGNKDELRAHVERFAESRVVKNDGADDIYARDAIPSSLGAVDLIPLHSRAFTAEERKEKGGLSGTHHEEGPAIGRIEFIHVTNERAELSALCGSPEAESFVNDFIAQIEREGLSPTLQPLDAPKHTFDLLSYLDGVGDADRMRRDLRKERREAKQFPTTPTKQRIDKRRTKVLELAPKFTSEQISEQLVNLNFIGASVSQVNRDKKAMGIVKPHKKKRKRK